MADHRTLVSSNVHEPKHISDSTVADAGKVITPLSGGTSELRNLTPEEIGLQFIYGEVQVNNNATAFAVTAASDVDLYTTTDYIQLNEVRLPAATLDENNGIIFNSVTNGITVPVSGTYRVSISTNIVSDTNNTKVGIKAKDGATWVDSTLKHDLAATGRVQSLATTFITHIAVGSEFTVWVAADKTCNLTVNDLRYSVELIRAT